MLAHWKRKVTVFTKQQILEELKRVAAELGRTPGRGVFTKETGIKESDWAGRYWVRWGEAVAEAGLSPNVMQTKLDADALAVALVDEIRRLGRFPTNNELKMRGREDAGFPGHTFARRAGGRAGLVRMAADLCASDPEEYADVLAILEPMGAESADVSQPTGRVPELVLGHVYLLKLGKHYKVGRSNAFGRRQRELAIQMPERATTVHVINTDDPVGIEAYWHRRFADRRVRNDAEWFALTAEDVRAFKRRKFQ